MAQGVADTEMIRRQNRQLVLDALRRGGPASRSQVATATGLSNASLTAIASDLVSEGILAELAEAPSEAKGRGRPAVIMAHRREAGYVLLIEIDVNRCRMSLLDYSGVLVDRVESAVGPTLFYETPPATYFIERIGVMLERNQEVAPAIHSVSISLQGILDAEGAGLKWSPLSRLAGHDLAGPIRAQLGLDALLYKRGRLMADGMRWLDARLANAVFSTIYIGSTIGMGLTWPAVLNAETDVGTEFGHLIHIPGGALCRCGARGCIEAYAADYAVLRSAYSVPEHATPASAVPPADYQQIIARARHGDRNALRAFTLAGEAIGAGIGRLISLFDIDNIVVLGPATAAFDLMQPGIEDAIGHSLMGKMRGLPPIGLVADAGEPIYRGLKMKALTSLDRTFAHRTASIPIRRVVE
ncbi:Sugar kinase of the NBD/HSP70 family, may contain an N-terminal HTH domain [Pelagibacterium luteolum]|uniref:Sugar kinase of the NBD/HSP70 family, may contain an N-terminal HTH domain n=1 Tax=Pelagibacterium luteolum TaxID=440168 RepID=A0A1G7ZMB9_9HYPH|nr:Sugar kinase of the NBD/HSP70 family, may contain an N-terminal HTH domain [Pelagibacterium luteolum]